MPFDGLTNNSRDCRHGVRTMATIGGLAKSQNNTSYWQSKPVSWQFRRRSEKRPEEQPGEAFSLAYLAVTAVVFAQVRIVDFPADLQAAAEPSPAQAAQHSTISTKAPTGGPVGSPRWSEAWSLVPGDPCFAHCPVDHLDHLAHGRKMARRLEPGGSEVAEVLQKISPCRSGHFGLARTKIEIFLSAPGVVTSPAFQVH